METINPKHIRIGNWIKGIYGKPIQVTANTIVILEMAPKWANGETGYKPIPITEQWLTDAGFEKERTSSDHIICFDLDGFQINTYIEFNGDFWLRHYHSHRNKNFKYVHQLQNIYLATSGEELIFNR